MLIFKTIRWKNLLSTGNNFIEIHLNKKHTTIMLGESGSGKSTLLDAIAFGLFGRPFRNINKNQLVNSINQKNCVVELIFTIGSNEYFIRRGIKPNIFEIFCNNKLLNQDAHIKDYQQYFEKQILKFNFKAFCQIVVLGASNFTPFMQLKPADRRVIIESLLDIEIFSVMNVLLKQKISGLKFLIQENDYQISLTKEKIEMQKKYVEELEKDKEEKIQENLRKIEENKTHIEELEKKNLEIQKEINELQLKLEFRTEVETQINKIADIQNKLESTIKKSKKEIQFYSDNDICPTCQQNIPEEFKIDEIKKKKDKIEECSLGLESAQLALSKLTSKMEEAKKLQDEVDGLVSIINKNKNQIVGIHQYMKKLAKDTLQMKEEAGLHAEQENIIFGLMEKLEELNKKKEKLLIDRSVQEMAAGLLKDSGVKARIIKQYLPLINKYTNKFLNAMNFFVTFYIDEEFNEHIKSRAIDDFSYANFSEGEKQRIDLALLFTWRTIAKMKNSVNTNLLVLDEVLDSYLDTVATENVLQLLNSEMFKDTNIFVISHKETITDKFHANIRFTKRKNFSTIE